MGDTIEKDDRVRTTTGRTGTVVFVEQGDDVAAVRLDGERELRAFSNDEIELIEE